MKKLLFVLGLVFMMIVLLNSCQKIEELNSIQYVEKAPPGLSNKPYVVYIDESALNSAKYLGNSSRENSYNNQYGEKIVQIYRQDYYEIEARKYFGPISGNLYYSNSVETYEINAEILNQVREKIKLNKEAYCYMCNTCGEYTGGANISGLFQ